ncbi:hypothetical protein TVAG_182990 [Trichomonas vaginalis G3]|uniref:Uncharacterized protein n=1 Tax=Trichomonas vaginalis (strain ATCC PRA-98 / G3) TaxID=412133 RepID=A2D937_TRIV3|nr:negative regulation of non-canonical Wnt signaling pathway [Trichomonas vaginalis G3]EAY23063.1 hypothetical protein TVAG_182990 [Trichomonas vaginalis G3]KAI5519031.1 negative regulation of non-canonical Wnt signaling pathway [Trichomonas vaginalis G3]|eukprot:XP_001584049.1 hypothetical protein [Trichomonas vaginalis G3]
MTMLRLIIEPDGYHVYDGAKDFKKDLCEAIEKNKYKDEFDKNIKKLEGKALKFLNKSIELDLPFEEDKISEFIANLTKKVKKCNPNEEINNTDAFKQHLERANGKITVTHNGFSITGQYHENRQDFGISINKEFFEKFLSSLPTTESSDKRTSGKEAQSSVGALYNEFYENLIKIMTILNYDQNLGSYEYNFDQRAFKDIKNINNKLNVYINNHSIKDMTIEKQAVFDLISAFFTKDNLEQLKLHKDKYDAINTIFTPDQLEFLKNPDEYLNTLHDFFRKYQIECIKHPEEFFDSVKDFFFGVDQANQELTTNQLLAADRDKYIKKPALFVGEVGEHLTNKQKIKIISPEKEKNYGEIFGGCLEKIENGRYPGPLKSYISYEDIEQLSSYKTKPEILGKHLMESFFAKLLSDYKELGDFLSEETKQFLENCVKEQNYIRKFFTASQIEAFKKGEKIYFTYEQMDQFRKGNQEDLVFFSQEQLNKINDKLKQIDCVLNFFTDDQLNHICYTYKITFTKEQMQDFKNPTVIFFNQKQLDILKPSKTLDKNTIYVKNPFITNLTDQQILTLKDLSPISLTEEQLNNLKNCSEIFTSEDQFHNFIDYELFNKTNTRIKLSQEEIRKRIDARLDEKTLNHLAEDLNNSKSTSSPTNLESSVFQKLFQSFDSEFIRNLFNKETNINKMTKEQIQNKIKDVFNNDVRDKLAKELFNRCQTQPTEKMQHFITDKQLISQGISIDKLVRIKSPEIYNNFDGVSEFKFSDDQIIILNNSKEIFLTEEQLNFFKSNSLIDLSDAKITKIDQLPPLEEGQKNILQTKSTSLQHINVLFSKEQKEILLGVKEISQPLISFFTQEKIDHLKGKDQLHGTITDLIPEEHKKYLFSTKKQLIILENLLTKNQKATLEKTEPSNNLEKFFTEEQINYFKNTKTKHFGESLDVILSPEQRDLFKNPSSFAEIMKRAFSNFEVNEEKNIFENINDALKSRNWVEQYVILNGFKSKSVFTFKLDKYSKIFWHLYKFTSVTRHYSQKCSPINLSNLIFCTKQTDIKTRVKSLDFQGDFWFINYIIIVGSEFLSENQRSELNTIIAAEQSYKTRIIIFTASGENKSEYLNEADLIKIEDNLNTIKSKRNIDYMDSYDKLRDKVHLVFNLVPGADSVKKLMKDHNFVTFYVSPKDPQIPKLTYLDKDVYLYIDPEIASENTKFFHQLYQFAFFRVTENFVENNLNEDRNLYIEFPSIGILNSLDDFPFPVKPENVHVLKPDYFTNETIFVDNRLNMRNEKITFEADGKVKVDGKEFGVAAVISQEEYIGKTLQNVLDNIIAKQFNGENLKYYDLLVKLYNIFFENQIKSFSLCTLRSLSTYFEKYYKWFDIKNPSTKSEKSTEKSDEIPVPMQLFFLESAFIVCTQHAFKNKKTIYMMPYFMFSPNYIEDYIIQKKISEKFSYDFKVPVDIYKFFRTNVSWNVLDYWPKAYELVSKQFTTNEEVKTSVFIAECNEFLKQFECTTECKYIEELCKAVENFKDLCDVVSKSNYQTLMMRREKEYKGEPRGTFINVSDLFGTISVTQTSFIRFVILLSRIAAQIPYCLTGETGCGKTMALEFLKEAFRIFKHDNYVFIFIDVNAETTIEDYINAKKQYILPGTDYQLISGEQHIHVIFDEANTSFICPQIFYEISQISKLPTNAFFSLSSGCMINKVAKTNDITDEMASNNVAQDLAQGKVIKPHDYILTKNYIKESHIQMKYFVNEQTNLISEYEIDCNPYSISDEKDDFMFEDEEITIKGKLKYFMNCVLKIEGKLKEKNLIDAFFNFAQTTLVESIRFIRCYYNDRAAASYREVDFVCSLFKDILKNDFDSFEKNDSDSFEKNDSDSFEKNDSDSFEKNNLYKAFFIAIFFRFVGRLPKKFKFKNDKIFQDHKRLKALYTQELAGKFKKEGINPRSDFLEYIFQKINSTKSNLPTDIQKSNDVLELFKKMSYRVSKDIFDYNQHILLFDALAEHFYAIIVCARTGFSTFLLGQPGTSKSFSCKALMNYIGNKLPPIKYAVFHSNRTCTSDGLKILFEECARQKLLHLMDKYYFINFIEEIGLLVNSEFNPTKIFHEILVKGVQILDQRVKIPVVAFSNYRLDFSNMNRAIIFFTDKYEREDFQRAIAFKAKQDKKEGNPYIENFDEWYHEFDKLEEEETAIYNDLLDQIQKTDELSMRHIFSQYFEIYRMYQKFKKARKSDYPELLKEIKNDLVKQTFIAYYHIDNNQENDNQQIPEQRIENLMEEIKDNQTKFRKGICVVSEGYAFCLALFDHLNDLAGIQRSVVSESDFTISEKDIFNQMLEFFKIDEKNKKSKLLIIIGYPKSMDTTLDLTNSNDTEYTCTFEDEGEEQYGHLTITNDIFGIKFSAKERFKILLFLPQRSYVKGPILDRFNIYDFPINKIQEYFYKDSPKTEFSVNENFKSFYDLYCTNKENHKQHSKHKYIIKTESRLMQLDDFKEMLCDENIKIYSQDVIKDSVSFIQNIKYDYQENIKDDYQIIINLTRINTESLIALLYQIHKVHECPNTNYYIIVYNCEFSLQSLPFCPIYSIKSLDYNLYLDASGTAIDFMKVFYKPLKDVMFFELSRFNQMEKEDIESFNEKFKKMEVDPECQSDLKYWNNKWLEIKVTDNLDLNSLYSQIVVKFEDETNLSIIRMLLHEIMRPDGKYFLLIKGKQNEKIRQNAIDIFYNYIKLSNEYPNVKSLLNFEVNIDNNENYLENPFSCIYGVFRTNKEYNAINLRNLDEINKEEDLNIVSEIIEKANDFNTVNSKPFLDILSEVITIPNDTTDYKLMQFLYSLKDKYQPDMSAIFVSLMCCTSLKDCKDYPSIERIFEIDEELQNNYWDDEFRNLSQDNESIYNYLSKKNFFKTKSDSSLHTNIFIGRDKVLCMSNKEIKKNFEGCCESILDEIKDVENDVEPKNARLDFLYKVMKAHKKYMSNQKLSNITFRFDKKFINDDKILKHILE